MITGNLHTVRQHVLVIEDDSEMRRCFRTLFEHFGYEVEVRSNAFQEPKILKDVNEVPDLIVSGIFIDGVDGPELLKVVRDNEQWREIPIILVSGMNDGLTRFNKLGKTLQIGPTTFLAKPFEIENLLAAVHKVTQGQEPTAAHILP